MIRFLYKSLIIFSFFVKVKYISIGALIFFILFCLKNTLPNSDLTLKMKKSDFKQEKLNSKQKKVQDEENASDQ